MNGNYAIVFFLIVLPATVGMFCIIMSFLYDKEDNLIISKPKNYPNKPTTQVSSTLYSDTFDLNNFSESYDEDDSASVIIDNSPT